MYPVYLFLWCHCLIDNVLLFLTSHIHFYLSPPNNLPKVVLKPHLLNYCSLGRKVKGKLEWSTSKRPVSHSPTTKARAKKPKGNKKDNFSPFLGSIGQKKEWASNKFEIVRVDESSKLTNNGVVLFWKRELPNLVLSVIFMSVL